MRQGNIKCPQPEPQHAWCPACRKVREKAVIDESFDDGFGMVQDYSYDDYCPVCGTELLECGTSLTTTRAVSRVYLQSPEVRAQHNNKMTQQRKDATTGKDKITC